MRLTILLLAAMLVPMAAAEEYDWGPEVTYSGVIIEGLGGEKFDVKIGIKADENATYSVELGDRAEFKFNENPIEMYIPANDTRTFIFEGEVIGEDGGGIAAGKYVMSWKTYKDGVKFNSGDIEISAGEQASSVGIIAAIAGIGLIATLRRRS
tara:strand:+ start:545 stop:1003 length:459 start_codon:yes stop_codon:yes gene_type:complete